MFWRKGRSNEQDVERELRTHLEAEEEEQRERGLSPELARDAARRALGNAGLIKEQVREVSGWIWVERLQQDVRYAMRAFGRTPAFTAVVVVTLALGIGATTAMFSVVEAVLLNPLPYANPDRLVVIWEKLSHNPDNPPVFDSYRDFETWKKSSHSFDQLAPATWATGGQILTGNGPARDVLAIPVGIDFFPLLGVAPEIGRVFQRDDLYGGCTVVLKHSFWAAAFGAHKTIIGRHVELNKKACTVIGVMPPEFTFYPDALAMWMLITPASDIARHPENANVGVFGRLKPGVSIAKAQNELQNFFTHEHQKDAFRMQRLPFVYPLAEQFAFLSGPNLRLTVTVLFAAVTFVLLVACVNIANLLLGRSLARQKEIAVRAALGSGRARLIRQLLSESLLLSFAGAVIGTFMAVAAVHFFRVMNPIEMPPGNPVRVNLPVLGFTSALAVLTAFLFGLVPALKASKVDLADAFRAGGRSASFGPGARTVAMLLVAGEVMLSLALLAGSGLLIESLNRLSAVPLGFRTGRVVSASVELPKWSYSTESQRARFYREAVERAGAIGGVESAAFASSLPFSNGRWGSNPVLVEGRPGSLERDSAAGVSKVSVTGNYFRVMGVALERGRAFGALDRLESEPVAIVNHALARRYFPREDPIGRHIKVGESGSEGRWLTIVGVTADELDKDFFHEMSWQSVPTVFRPVDQEPPQTGSLVLRTISNGIPLAAAVQSRMAALDGSVPTGDLQGLDDKLSHLLAYPRFRAAILGSFAAIAVALEGVGLYGVLSQSIAQRTQEFGVRMALGAQERDMVGLVFRQGIAMTFAGIVGGLVVALIVTRFLSSLLYGVSATDPLTFAGVSALLLFVAVLAIVVPARKAARVDPMIALRYE